ncbi:hypothetical protein H0V99_04120 [Candidatus Saccharibacteria bacterium]|nr:hypothetical protein [Candidatus Saccharibacteria bacterium]
MVPEYWQKQTKDTPLFPDLLWSRPENRAGAGKLLIAGGNSMGFAAVGEAYSCAVKSGAGIIRAILPNSIRTHFPRFQDQVLEIEFAPSTPSGSFAKSAQSELLNHSAWADMVLLAGDVGRNSETSVMLEGYLQKYLGPVTITKDVVDYFYSLPELLANRPKTTLVLSMAQLQKLGTALKFETPFLLSMGMLMLSQALHKFTERYPVVIITKELDNLVVAYEGKVSSTKLQKEEDIWRVGTAAAAAVFWMQNPHKPFEAITTSLVAE